MATIFDMQGVLEGIKKIEGGKTRHWEDVKADLDI